MNIIPRTKHLKVEIDDDDMDREYGSERRRGGGYTSGSNLTRYLATTIGCTDITASA